MSIAGHILTLIIKKGFILLINFNKCLINFLNKLNTFIKKAATITIINMHKEDINKIAMSGDAQS